MSRVLFQDRLLLVVALAMGAWNILMTALLEIDSAEAQSLRCAVALLLMVAGSLFCRAIRSTLLFALVPAVASLVLLILPLIVNVGFQTAFPALVLLMLSFIILLAERKQLFSVILALSGFAFLLLQNDPSSACIWSITFLLLFWACSGNPFILLVSAGLVALSGYAFTVLYPGLFISPDKASILESVHPGWFGLDISDPFWTQPPSSGRSLFPWIPLHYGWIIVLCFLAFYPIIILRGSSLARASESRLHGMIAMGAVILIALETIAALLSNFGIWPVQDLSMPVLSGETPSLGAFFFLIGLCSGVSALNHAHIEEDAHIASLAG